MLFNNALLTSSLRNSTETCVSMVDMKFVPRCTTKAYSRHYQYLCPKYVYVILHATPNRTARMVYLSILIRAVQLTLGGGGFFFSTSRFHRLWRNISTPPKRRPRTRRRWYTSLPKMSLPFCGVSRESTVARAAYERASSADPARSAAV
jgi:hypothetical protein